MSKLARNAIAVGLLTVAAAVAVYLGILYVSEEVAEETVPYYALFSDATGLVEMSYVKTAGIPIGSVVSIRLQEGKARVDIRVSKKYPVYQNAVLSKRAASLVTGDYYLNLWVGTADQKKIPPGGRIKHVLEGTEMDVLALRVDEITKDVKQITASLSQIFGTPEGRAKVESVIDDIQKITDKIANLLERNAELVTQTVKNVEGTTSDARLEIREIVSNIKDITADIKEIIKTHEGDVEETVEDLKGSVKKLSSVLEKLDRTMSNVEDVTEKVKEGRGTVGKLVRDEEVAENVADVAEGAGELLKSISKLQTIVSLRSDYNFIATTLKTYVGIYVQPKEDKFYMIEVVDDPRGRTEVEEFQFSSDHPQSPSVWHEKRVRKTDAFKFSFMFGRRISLLTFRFGIKESSGGIGLDLFLLKDSLKIEANLFEFGGNLYPRLNLTAALRFLSKVYVLGGVDDILNRDRTDYFVGAMLRFNDEDLKAVLAFAPSFPQ